MSFKIGDTVRCKAGYNTSESSGGAGYQPYRVFVIEDISGSHETANGTILWPKIGDYGIYAHACEYLEQEVQGDSKLIFKFLR